MSDDGAIERFDRAVDELFDHLRGNTVADRLFYVASELGDFSLIWHILGTAQGVVRPDPPVVTSASPRLIDPIGT